jgi:hypothetical protein
MMRNGGRAPPLLIVENGIDVEYFDLHRLDARIHPRLQHRRSRAPLASIPTYAVAISCDLDHAPTGGVVSTNYGGARRKGSVCTARRKCCRQIVVLVNGSRPVAPNSAEFGCQRHTLDIPCI